MSRKKASDFQDDPIVSWAEDIAADPRYQSDPSLEHFVTLKKHYVALLRRFSRVTRISDSYQQTLKDVNESLSEAARRDHLTGLPNRRELVDRIKAQIARAQRYGERFSLVLADIDNFKCVNDTYGHDTGDEVLIAVGHALEGSLRGDDTCARWGGEEFLICLPHTNLEGARAVAEKLRATVEHLDIEHAGNHITPTVSAGIAEHSQEENLDDTVRKADDAMFEAKRGGRNRVYVLE